MSKTANISLAIIEDDEEIRLMLETLIAKTPCLDCQLSFGSCEEGLEAIKEARPDVVLMDIELPGMSGIEGIRMLKPELEETDFIILSVKDDDDSVFQSLTAGATGYLLKECSFDVLVKSIREVNNGGSPMSAVIARKVTQFFRPITENNLSDREIEILNLLYNGRNYNQIAATLFISGHTVRNHIKNIYQKMHVHNRAEAVYKAIKDGFLGHN